MSLRTGIIYFHIQPWWRNWQTRTLEGCVLYGVEVRVLSRANNQQRDLTTFATGLFDFISFLASLFTWM